LHSGLWEKLADAFFWLQLTWILSGFLLMAYFALKVFPADKECRNSRSDSVPSPRKAELITLGSYRFEVPTETTAPSNVIELYQKHNDRNAGLR
jgi:hypothetical protein